MSGFRRTSQWVFLVVVTAAIWPGPAFAQPPRPEGNADHRDPAAGKSPVLSGNGKVAGATALLIVVILLSGAFGGLIMGFDSSRPNKVNLPFRSGRSVPLGMFGDMLIGAAASLAISFVTDPLFNTTPDDDPFGKSRGVVRLVSLGVISGFAGIKVLTSMSDLPIRLINASRAQIMDQVQEQDRSRELIRQVEDTLREVDQRAKTDEAAAQADLDKAEQAIEQVLKHLPDDPRSLVVSAKVFRRKAELNVGGKADPWWQSAIDVLTNALRIDPTYDRAHYNRACYYALIKKEKEALADLKQAVALFAPNRVFARGDSDFASLKGNAEFQKLIK
jgi:hypothetical protein